MRFQGRPAQPSSATGPGGASGPETTNQSEKGKSMTLAAEMLHLSPSPAGFNHEELAACIEACFDCVQVCTACADACLGEDDVAELRRCIALNLSCADSCAATGRVLTRQSGFDAALSRAMLEACRQACRHCAEECERHAHHHEHCRVCAEVCRRCETACNALLAAAAAPTGP